ncbi:hypothetical protein Kpol_1018p74 [Vanderwaltozyma polyspora DSM 70294]|uniref:PX domain-containing protein n=1 Tax=Vanderwaltozyma polyspora (strain ATCC 22028 / DSM 70294 / BCRC 21397 / CBS 2163 / NBRC 10782 / NRRL Y-8283 / UCD 57-17) TaxID=436907 RepID=A7TDS2_VANPO|nr:uncharacterized protein Kpol_1018p74 [Vanderwaltozyma polyspora DSM 70294]EDO19542.1 hypothetical protein Kpol_1018p74 [Vanderwaltozyma polyspora DSM 70294]
MEFEDDLTAPVWDELGTGKPNIVEQKKQRYNGDRKVDLEFGSFGMGSTSLGLKTEGLDHVVDIDSGTVVNSNDHGNDELYLWGDHPDTSDLKGTLEGEEDKKLIDQLAPPSLSSLDISGVDVEITSVDENKPLFGDVGKGDDIFPLKLDTESNNILKDRKVSSSSLSKSSKRNVLFTYSRSSHQRNKNSDDNSISKDDISEVDDPLSPKKKIDKLILLDSLPNKNNNDISHSNTDELELSINEDQESSLSEHVKNKREMVSGSEEEEIVEAPVDFIINVTDPIKVGDMTSAHVEYLITSKSPLLEPNSSSVYRRYSDVRWLYRQLQSNHWGRVVPPPPEKQIIGRFQVNFIEYRRSQFELMLRDIANDPVLQKDDAFISFLTSVDFFNERRILERLSGSYASNDSSDLSEVAISEIKLLGKEDAELVIREGGIDSEYSSSFMNITFISPMKYRETDETLKKEKQKIDILELHLKQLYRSLDLIDLGDREILKSIEEFSDSLQLLSPSELLEKSNILLSKFSRAHIELNEILKNYNFGDLPKLCMIQDYYVRSILSLKAIFNQRDKLGYYLIIVEDDYLKLRTRVHKAEGSPLATTNAKKVDMMKDECLLLENRYKRIKYKWNEIGKEIKKELIRFNFDKFISIKAKILNFVELSILIQHKKLEIWEQFYKESL